MVGGWVVLSAQWISNLLKSRLLGVGWVIESGDLVKIKSIQFDLTIYHKSK